MTSTPAWVDHFESGSIEGVGEDQRSTVMRGLYPRRGNLGFIASMRSGLTYEPVNNLTTSPPRWSRRRAAYPAPVAVQGVGRAHHKNQGTDALV